MTVQSFKEKVLPIQPCFSHYYKNSMESFISSIYDIAIDFSDTEKLIKKLKITDSDKFKREEMGSNPITLQFLQFLILAKQAINVLEIGTFLGISTLCMASVLPRNGTITTIEKFDHFAELARKNFRDNQMTDKIKLIEGDAFEILMKMKKEKKFDIIFLDGNKERYADYFKILDSRMDSGGILVVDDIFFHGDALNTAPITDKGRGVKKFLQNTVAINSYHKTILPISNGIIVMIKRYNTAKNN